MVTREYVDFFQAKHHVKIGPRYDQTPNLIQFAGVVALLSLLGRCQVKKLFDVDMSMTGSFKSQRPRN